MRYLWLIALIPGWMLQYTLVVPCIWTWRSLVVPAFKLGALGILLLCIPVIGWIVLAVIIFRRPAPKRDSSYAKPWGKSLLEAN